jgi:hypothetical protein
MLDRIKDIKQSTPYCSVKKGEFLMMIPVIVLKNKQKEARYLASSMDVGDWSDKDLDVSIDDIENAFMIWRKDLTKPTEQDLAEVKAESVAHKKYMLEKFGENAVISYNVEKWLEYYEPVHLEISIEQYEYARDLS